MLVEFLSYFSDVSLEKKCKNTKTEEVAFVSQNITFREGHHAQKKQVPHRKNITVRFFKSFPPGFINYLAFGVVGR